MATVLITGCSSGFGRGAALEFARAGHTVVATMRTPAKGKDLVAEAEAAGGELRVLALDVLDDASVSGAIEEAVSAVGPLDVVVNNAGIELHCAAASRRPARPRCRRSSTPTSSACCACCAPWFRPCVSGGPV